MNRFRSFLIASVGFLILVLTLTLTDVGRTVAQSTGECIRICTDAPLHTVVQNVLRIVGDVKITNDSDSPIPTRVNGQVQIASSPRNA